jgi:hypothetical protein
MALNAATADALAMTGIDAEIERIVDRLDRALGPASEAGELTPGAIEAAIREFRRRHPYRPGASRPAWEYRRVTIDRGREDPDRVLNKLGAEGWEAWCLQWHATSFGVTFWLKRPAG